MPLEDSELHLEHSAHFLSKSLEGASIKLKGPKSSQMSNRSKAREKHSKKLCSTFGRDPLVGTLQSQQLFDRLQQHP